MDETRDRLVLLTRARCHLCDVARQALDRVTSSSGQPWREIDIDTDPVLQAEYWDRIPVVLLDGREVATWRVEPDRLLRELGRVDHG